MKRFVMAIALACVLSATVLAGDVPSTDKATPAPTSQASSPVLTVLLIIINAVAR